LKKEATDFFVLLTTVDEVVGKGSMVMLWNLKEYGIARLMPAARATERYCNLDMSMIARASAVMGKLTRLRMLMCAQYLVSRGCLLMYWKQRFQK
jgi:hypothetical protein